MSKQFKLFFIIFCFLYLSFPLKIFASGFQLKSIGVLNMDGVTVNHIWYSNGNCQITGVAQPNSSVRVKVDQNPEETVQVNTEGVWIYNASLSQGDHQIVFTDSTGAVIAKTLTIGNIPKNIGALPKAETPTVGNAFPLVLFSFLGIIFLIFPLIYLKKFKFSP